MTFGPDHLLFGLLISKGMHLRGHKKPSHKKVPYATFFEFCLTVKKYNIDLTHPYKKHDPYII